MCVDGGLVRAVAQLAAVCNAKLPGCPQFPWWFECRCLPLALYRTNAAALFVSTGDLQRSYTTVQTKAQLLCVLAWCTATPFLQMLVEAETEDGARHSTLLQNAETVRLICPGAAASSKAPSWEAVSVSALQPGQRVYLLMQEGARHTGISIQERISER